PRCTSSRPTSWRVWPRGRPPAPIASAPRARRSPKRRSRSAASTEPRGLKPVDFDDGVVSFVAARPAAERLAEIVDHAVDTPCRVSLEEREPIEHDPGIHAPPRTQLRCHTRLLNFREVADVTPRKCFR